MRRDPHQDTPAGIGIGIALKRRVLALANLGTISNVNQPVINLLAPTGSKNSTKSKNINCAVNNPLTHN